MGFSDAYKYTKGAVLLDVREPDEYRRGHMPGAKNLPVYQLDKAPSVIKNKGTPVFVYCQSGSRSYQAAGILKQMGYTNVKTLGGINSYSGRLER